MLFFPFILSQILAACAIGTDTLAMHSKNRKTILLFIASSCFLLAIHFVLLQEYIAGVVTFSGGIRAVIAGFSSSKKLIPLFLVVESISFYFLYEHWYSWFSLIASFLFVISNFQSNEKYLRLIMMGGTSFWILHNSFAHTPVGVLVEVIFLSNNIWGYFRHHINKIHET